MSKEDTEENSELEGADDRLFNGEAPTDPDDVVVVEGKEEDGFEATTDEPAVQPQQKEEGTESEDDGLGGLPPAAVAAIRDERKKRQGIEAKLEEEREARLRLEGRFEAQPQPQGQQQEGNYIPNPATDPQGYHDYMQNQMVQQEAQTRLRMSENLAVQEYGQDEVKAAMDAFNASAQTDPTGFQHRYDTFGRSGHPIAEVVKWHKEHSLLNEIGGDPEAYKAKLREEWEAEQALNGQGQQPQTTSQPLQQKRQLPPRAAAQPGVMRGGPATQTMEDAESSLWGRK